MPQLFNLPKAVPLSSAGGLLAGAKAYFYATGTTTPKDTFTDFALSVAHANPVVADASGVFAPIYLENDARYRLTLKTSADVLIYTVDDVGGPVATAEELGVILNPTTVAETAASVTPTSHIYDTTDYGDMRRYGLPMDGSTNATTALNKAIAVADNAGDLLVFKFPRGNFKFTTQPSDITGPMRISGEGRNVTYLNRDYSPAASSTGLFNLRATGQSSDIRSMCIHSGSGRTGGSLISIVQPSSGDGADWSNFEDIRFTSDVAIGGAGNSHNYNIYFDGSARSSPQGVRSVFIKDCVMFGGSLGAAYIQSVVNFNWANTSTYSAGGTSGKVVITGTSGVHSSYVSIQGTSIYGLALDYVDYLNVHAAEINGDITNTVNTNNVVIVGMQSAGTRDSAWLNSVFIDPSAGVLREKTGGNAVTARYNGSNPRAGLYTAGTSGQSFLGGNLAWSSGNTFNYDKTGTAWYFGDPGANGRLSIGCATGTAGNDASVTGTSDAVRITTDGNIYPGRTSSTSMTNGFIYVPSGAGNPSGTPTAISGYAPLYVDTTNNKLFFYSGGAWRDAGP